MCTVAKKHLQEKYKPFLPSCSTLAYSGCLKKMCLHSVYMDTLISGNGFWLRHIVMTRAGCRIAFGTEM